MVTGAVCRNRVYSQMGERLGTVAPAMPWCWAPCAALLMPSQARWALTLALPPCFLPSIWPWRIHWWTERGRSLGLNVNRDLPHLSSGILGSCPKTLLRYRVYQEKSLIQWSAFSIWISISTYFQGLIVNYNCTKNINSLFPWYPHGEEAVNCA